MARTLQPLRVLIAAGALAGSVFAAPAAGAADLSPTAEGFLVRYSPSELENDSGAENVYRKLRFAAREVCEPGATVRSLSERVQSERCYQQVLASVVQKINRPMLTSIHQAKASKVG